MTHTPVGCFGVGVKNVIHPPVRYLGVGVKNVIRPPVGCFGVGVKNMKRPPAFQREGVFRNFYTASVERAEERFGIFTLHPWSARGCISDFLQHVRGGTRVLEIKEQQ